jgi:hypothetical protein
VALIARAQMRTCGGTSRRPSESSKYRGTRKERAEVALSPNSPSDADPICRGSLTGPLCNVGSLQKPLWVSGAWWYARWNLVGMLGIVVRSWTLFGEIPPGFSVGEAGVCTHGRSGVCWSGSRGGSSVARRLGYIQREWYQVLSRWCFASACPTTCSRGRAEKRRRASLASRRRAP